MWARIGGRNCAGTFVLTYNQPDLIYLTLINMSVRTLVIGNKNYSSWSLRPWLFLRKNGIAFKEQQLWLDEPEFAPAIAAYPSGGKVPLLLDEGTAVWDSLAIIETAIDRYDCQYGWPSDLVQRAHARSISFEMHSSFMALRAQCPMDIRGAYKLSLSDATHKDIARVIEIWSQALQLSGRQGRWLYGDFSAADAMFAPVVFRFRSLGLTAEPQIHAYMDYVLADDILNEWISAAQQESRTIAYE